MCVGAREVANPVFGSLVRLLREELQLLQESGSYVGEVVKAMDKKKVLVKVSCTVCRRCMHLFDLLYRFFSYQNLYVIIFVYSVTVAKACHSSRAGTGTKNMLAAQTFRGVS